MVKTIWGVSSRFGYIAGLCLFVACAAPAKAAPAAFEYMDDFETEKARVDSYRHSPFQDGAGIPEMAYLYYGQYPARGIGPFNDVLEFLANSQPGGAFIAYQLPPAQAPIGGGSIAFDRPDPNDRGVLSVRVSNDDAGWLTLGQSVGASPVGRYVLPIPPATSVRFVELRGGGTIDNLRISIEYVPEPAGAGLLVCGAATLALRRRKR